MNKLFTILAVLLSLSIATPALSYAESDQSISLEELEGLSTNARNEIIKKRLKAFNTDKGILGNVADANPRDIEAWAKAISTGIKVVCKDLSIGVNEFAKTDVGKITMFLIVYKVIGQDIKRIIFGVLLWVVTMPLILMSFIHFHTKRKMKILDNEGKVTDFKYITRYEWDSNDAKSFSAVVHGAMFVAITIGCAVALFA